MSLKWMERPIRITTKARTGDDGADREQDEEPGGGQEGQKGVVVSYTHTIVDPGAVMIESLYTLMAPCTVSTSYCPQDLAFGA
jgi:hypothetical protein